MLLRIEPKQYLEEVAPFLEEELLSLLLDWLPRYSNAHPNILELGCTTGCFSNAILSRLADDGSLVALLESSTFEELALSRLDPLKRNRVRFENNTGEKLPFAVAAFDGIFGLSLAPEAALEKVAQEASRILKPNGLFVLGLLLYGSFQELFDTFQEVLEKEELNQLEEGLSAVRQKLPTPQKATGILAQSGLVDCDLVVSEASIAFQNGEALLGSLLARRFCLDLCLSLVSEPSWREGILAGMARSLDTYFPQGLKLTLVLAGLKAHKL